MARKPQEAFDGSEWVGKRVEWTNQPFRQQMLGEVRRMGRGGKAVCMWVMGDDGIERLLYAQDLKVVS